MTDETKKMLWIAGGAVVVAGIYVYLKRSGTWDQWFGGAGTLAAFDDPAKLLAYAAQNPGGKATFVDQTGSHTASCAEWLRVNSASASGAGTGPGFVGQTAGPAIDNSPIDQVMLAKLNAAASVNPIINGQFANVAQWNQLLTDLDPQAQVTDLTEVGAGSGTMTAQRYLELRATAGLTSLPPAPTKQEHPYSWGTDPIPGYPGGYEN